MRIKQLLKQKQKKNKKNNKNKKPSFCQIQLEPTELAVGFELGKTRMWVLEFSFAQYVIKI